MVGALDLVREKPFMDISTVAIMSPGDMGHAVGQRLRENEMDVITCLVGRSAQTRNLAAKAGIRDVPSIVIGGSKVGHVDGSIIGLRRWITVGIERVVTIDGVHALTASGRATY